MPNNRRLGATRPPTLPILITRLNKSVNRGQQRSTTANGGQTCQKSANLAGMEDGRGKTVLVVVAEGRRTTGLEDGNAVGLGYGIPESREFFKTTP
ncbi:hypothetical protein Tco_1087292 [Tanacetum coccineum]